MIEQKPRPDDRQPRGDDEEPRLGAQDAAPDSPGTGGGTLGTGTDWRDQDK